MQRRRIEPRRDWPALAERVGFDWHTPDGETYWVEDACYSFSLREIEDEIEAATAELNRLCLALVPEIIDKSEVYDRLKIPEHARSRIVASWRAQEPSLYGRFDLAYDGSGPPKLLEFNADTPTSLFEAAVFQWQWLEDQKQARRLPAAADQFNSLHERLIARWKEMPRADLVHFAAMKDSFEDWRTIDYLADVAAQSGRGTKLLDMGDIGLGGTRFFDRDSEAIELLFKLYPWEWVFPDNFGSSPAMGMTRFVEPAWKCLLSNKGLLPLLWEMALGHPNLLPAYFESDDRKTTIGNRFARKPIWSREGANVLLIDGEDVVGHTSGTYGTEGYIRQSFVDIQAFDGMFPVLGSWIVGDEPAGMGIREDATRITGNRSRFVPHVIV